MKENLVLVKKMINFKKLKLFVLLKAFELQVFYYKKIRKKTPVRPFLFMLKYAPDSVVKHFMHKTFYLDQEAHRIFEIYIKQVRK